MVKSVKLEWMLGLLDKALELIELGMKAFSDFPKLWMMKGQIQEEKGQYDLARDTYHMGVSLASIEGRGGGLNMYSKS